MSLQLRHGYLQPAALAVCTLLGQQQDPAPSHLQERRTWNKTRIGSPAAVQPFYDPQPGVKACRSSQGACAFAIEFLLALGRMCFSDSLASIIAQNQGLNHNSLPRETPPSDIQKHITQLLQEGNACGCGRTQGFVSDIKLGSSTSNTSSMKKIETKLHRSADKPEKTNKQTHKRINDFPKVSTKART